MRILCVWASSSFSTRDVTTGYRSALIRAGHDVRDYRLDQRLVFIANAMPDAHKSDAHAVMKMATEGVLVEATYHGADLVLIISGMHFHPIGLWLLRQHGFRTAAILTESPYEDEAQEAWASANPEVLCFTHERISARRRGWGYLPHAYDPEIHRPVEPDPDEACDVLLMGTGWKERQELLEAIDWTGIDLRVRGLWPLMMETSPLWPYYVPGCVANAELPRAYAACKIALNPHRVDADAESLNPRAYELAACGTFQVSDGRAEQREIFGESVATARTSAELTSVIRYYLAHDDERRACAADARRRVRDHTFDRRVADLMAALEPAEEGVRTWA